MAMIPMVSLHPDDSTLCAEIQPSFRWLPGDRQTPVMPQVMEASHGQTRTMPRSRGTHAPDEAVSACGLLDSWPCAESKVLRRCRGELFRVELMAFGLGLPAPNLPETLVGTAFGQAGRVISLMMRLLRR